MSKSLSSSLVEAARKALSEELKALCVEIGAAESSLLFPVGAELSFFASNNPRLMQEDAPRVPINASFTGVAFRTGQLVAVANASGQKQHYGAVDIATKERTREFAAIPVFDGEVLGVLTLVNRASVGPAPAPFTLDELRRAEGFAREAAAVLRRLPGLRDASPDEHSARGSLGADLFEGLKQLDEGERRVVGALVTALIANRRAR